MVSVFIANTDLDWFDFLSAEPALQEVNFWQPSGAGFHAIGPGEYLAFRLKSPRNRIGGFGTLSGSSVLPLQFAWETFGRANGAASYEVLRRLIERNRGASADATTSIGCRVLVEPVFLPEDLWFDLPPSWSRNIMGGKRFPTDEPEGLRLWQQLNELAGVAAIAPVAGLREEQARYGAPTLVTPRLGQGAFRVAVTEAYRRQCAISAGKVLPALDAAHIRPFAEGGVHAKANGILFRKDIHSVFDAGYATVGPDYRFVVSDKVREVFQNGNEYRRLHGNKLALPANRADWPDKALLRWHNEERFLG